MWQEYYRPATTTEAVRLLADYRGEARIIAGGTDLVIDLRKGSKKAKALVEILCIKDLAVLEQRGDAIHIGAAVTHAQAAASELIKQHATALAEGSNCVGSLQIRHAATVVGNIVNAQPAADAAIALVALGAVADILGLDGQVRSVPVEELYSGPGKSKIDSSQELVVAVRLSRRSSLSLPMLNVAAWLKLAGGQVVSARIAAGPVAPHPARLKGAEAALVGGPLSPERVAAAAAAGVAEANPRSSLLRGSREYRLDALAALIRRAVTAAADRA